MRENTTEQKTTTTCRYNEVISRDLSESKRLVFQERSEGRVEGGREGGRGLEGWLLAIEVSRFSSNWQPLKRFRGRAGVEAA